MRARSSIALVLLAASVSVLIAAPAPGDVAPRLPDVDPVAPYFVSTFSDRRAGRTRYHVSFGSAAENVGPGPLIILGHRPSTATALMRADQVIDVRDPATMQPGDQQTVPGVGVLRYTRSSDHSHWHFLGFMRYELRRASNFRRVARDRKTGFCLGDRYPNGVFNLKAARAAGARVEPGDLDDTCGERAPNRLEVIEGISSGWGDDYKPVLEGQSIDITTLPAGRYVLVHRANVEGRIREANYTNNSSSALIAISRRGRRGRPTVRLVHRCPHTARCGSRLAR